MAVWWLLAVESLSVNEGMHSYWSNSGDSLIGYYLSIKFSLRRVCLALSLQMGSVTISL